MRRFKFSLEPVLKLREQFLELTEQRMREANATLDHERTRVTEANERELLCVRELHDAATGELDLQQLRVMRRYLAGVQRARHSHQMALLKAQEQARRTQLELAEAARDALVVESLRDARLSSHNAEAAASAQKALDEAAVLRAARRQTEEHECTS